MSAELLAVLPELAGPRPSATQSRHDVRRTVSWTIPRWRPQSNRQTKFAIGASAVLNRSTFTWRPERHNPALNAIVLWQLVLLTPVAVTAVFPHNRNPNGDGCIVRVNGAVRAAVLCRARQFVLPADKRSADRLAAPVGHQIIGPEGEDRTMIAFARCSRLSSTASCRLRHIRSSTEQHTASTTRKLHYRIPGEGPREMLWGGRREWQLRRCI